MNCFALIHSLIGVIPFRSLITPYLSINFLHLILFSGVSFLWLPFVVSFGSFFSFVAYKYRYHENNEEKSLCVYVCCVCLCDCLWRVLHCYRKNGKFDASCTDKIRIQTQTNQTICIVCIEYIVSEIFVFVLCV